jgi:hypothetical protein
LKEFPRPEVIPSGIVGWVRNTRIKARSNQFPSLFRANSFGQRLDVIVWIGVAKRRFRAAEEILSVHKRDGSLVTGFNEHSFLPKK